MHRCIGTLQPQPGKKQQQVYHFQSHLSYVLTINMIALCVPAYAGLLFPKHLSFMLFHKQEHINKHTDNDSVSQQRIETIQLYISKPVSYVVVSLSFILKICLLYEMHDVYKKTKQTPQ